MTTLFSENRQKLQFWTVRPSLFTTYVVYGSTLNAFLKCFQMNYQEFAATVVQLLSYIHKDRRLFIKANVPSLKVKFYISWIPM